MSLRALQPARPWDGRRVVLGVTGGIAAYKSVQLARDLTRLGSRVDVVMTKAAQQFVKPLSFRAVTGREVHTELFSGSGPAVHISLGAMADLVVVAPATADFLARAAQGMADDLLTTVLLAASGKVLLCPAMNDAMYRHPQTQRNLHHLQDPVGYAVAGPGVGPLAFGEADGPGRMLEPEEIVQHVGRALGASPAWEGLEVLVTAGPTREPVDPVRYVGNRSSGRMGYALAEAAWRRGANVSLVSGPTSLDPPTGVEVVRVQNAAQMLEAVQDRVGQADVLLFSAAVSDFRPGSELDSKLKRSGEESGIELRLEPTTDIAKATLTGRKPGAISLGFALETEDLQSNARKKLTEKGFHLIAANPALEEGAGFEVETNRVVILDADGGVEELPLLPKTEVAEKLLDRLSAFLPGAE